MAYASSQEFTKHSENLSQVQKTMTQLERQHKQAIRKNDEPAVMALRIVHRLLLGVEAEARLRKIISDPTGFNEREQSAAWDKREQAQRWTFVVELAFRRHYTVPLHDGIDSSTIGTSFNHYQHIVSTIETSIRPVIEERNKLAHGQWRWQLKSRQEKIFKADAVLMSDMNYSALTARRQYLEAITQLVYILVVSEPTFQRDFNTLTQKMANLTSEMDGNRYQEFAKSIRTRRPPVIQE
ncbi:hypothetical protein [Nakamurella multipartita]|uniref:MAE-28990/MAE-18760-like HEPN domain-containing protein n=1 Tax=Nakamurella multipartita (strain ATCC 700099 / DSM 44233 / CIP 104796 / JCM 9543 / NBRC 105858 / Y-104) TaxID=479431 RepID=C8XHD8_NAKMY|nr:hypothetical protein [Nakamurella multipartita]ACV78344.1 hypothetical protein Namu_1955 [Nakamurella multipartita DSM 44233]